MRQLKDKKSIADSTFSIWNKIYRVCWSIIYLLFFRFTFIPFFSMRVAVLRLLGARIDKSSRVYPSSSIWSPANLEIGEDSTIGPRVKVYNQGRVYIGSRCVISQDASLCASSHDYEQPLHPLFLSPINIENDAWICAEAFVGPGVTVGEGAVIGARAVLMKDADPWSVYAGNPAIKIKTRKRFDES
jgi:putative colanic acid biosynthesis acetyltransferase WcaF